VALGRGLGLFVAAIGQKTPVKSTYACRQSFANNAAKELGLKMNVQLTGLQEVFGRVTFQIPPNLVVKSQAIDMVEVI
jgi:hypothetical protein